MGQALGITKLWWGWQELNPKLPRGSLQWVRLDLGAGPSGIKGAPRVTDLLEKGPDGWDVTGKLGKGQVQGPAAPESKQQPWPPSPKRSPDPRRSVLLAGAPCGAGARFGGPSQVQCNLLLETIKAGLERRLAPACLIGLKPS